MQIVYNGCLYEEKFTIHNVDDFEKEDIYNIFKDSYEKSTGSSWSKEKFFDRANLWTFYGDPKKGFITVRTQRSGPIKITGVAGNPMSAYKGLKELIDTEHKPIWGMATKDIVDKMKKMGFISPPAFLIKIMMKVIPASVFGGVASEVLSDGGVKFSYNDVGDSVKYFFANKDYYKHLISQGLPDVPALFKPALNMFMKTIQ